MCLFDLYIKKFIWNTIYILPHTMQFRFAASFVCSFIRSFGRSLPLLHRSYALLYPRIAWVVYYSLQYAQANAHVQFNSYSFGKIMTIYRIKWMAKNASHPRSPDTGEAHIHIHNTTMYTSYSCVQYIAAPSTPYRRQVIKQTTAKRERANATHTHTLDWMGAGQDETHRKKCIYAESEMYIVYSIPHSPYTIPYSY